MRLQFSLSRDLVAAGFSLRRSDTQALACAYKERRDRAQKAARLLIALLPLLLSACAKAPNTVEGPASPPSRASTRPVGSAAQSDTGLTLGNPSNAVADGGQKDNYLLDRPQFALAYNDSLGRPNWVGWHLNEIDIGEIDRGQFRPDMSLPSDFYRVTPKDYTNTGYDRGHNCPSKDRSATREDNDTTFLMSNIMPQAPGNNQGPWKELEDYTRSLVEKGDEAYIVCGSTGERERIGKGKVSAPQSTWKVIVILPERSGDDLARIDGRTRVIAVRMPNMDDIREKDWRTMRVTVAEIEKETGYNLLSNLPQTVQEELEKKVDRE